ncbi:YkvA family protein [Caminibacter sp.]
MPNIEESKKFEKDYSDDSFWDKVKNFAKKAGCEVLEKALTLYYTAKDEDTPAHVKAVIFAALGYFISPLDAIPDVTPIVGFSDDLGVLVATIAMVVSSIKEEHKIKAKEKLSQFLDCE